MEVTGWTGVACRCLWTTSWLGQKGCGRTTKRERIRTGDLLRPPLRTIPLSHHTRIQYNKPSRGLYMGIMRLHTLRQNIKLKKESMNEEERDQRDQRARREFGPLGYHH